MRIAGADPGKKGALVVISCESAEGAYYRLKYNKAGHLDEDGLMRFLELTQPNQIVLEKVKALSGRMRSSSTSSFNFGFACGELTVTLRYWASIRNAAMHYVTPQAWQKELHTSMPEKLKAKEKSLLTYQRVFPHQPGKTPRQKQTDDNVIDALLLATFGVLRFGSGGLRPWELVHCLGTVDDESGGNVLPLVRRSKP